MEKELKSKGHKVQFTIMNHYFYKSSVGNQTKRCDFPVFQDTNTTNAWSAMKGGKEYWWVYNKSGQLDAWLTPWGSAGLNLWSGGSGAYNKLRDLIIKLQ